MVMKAWPSIGVEPLSLAVTRRTMLLAFSRSRLRAAIDPVESILKL